MTGVQTCALPILSRRLIDLAYLAFIDYIYRGIWPDQNLGDYTIGLGNQAGLFGKKMATRVSPEPNSVSGPAIRPSGGSVVAVSLAEISHTPRRGVQPPEHASQFPPPSSQC